MPSKRPFRVTRDVPGGINPSSFGRKAGMGASAAGWTERMSSSGRGAKEGLVQISGGRRGEAETAAPGVQYCALDAHGHSAAKGAAGGEEVRSRGIRASASVCNGAARRAEGETRRASACASGGEGGARVRRRKA